MKQCGPVHRGVTSHAGNASDLSVVDQALRDIASLVEIKHEVAAMPEMKRDGQICGCREELEEQSRDHDLSELSVIAAHVHDQRHVHQPNNEEYEDAADEVIASGKQQQIDPQWKRQEANKPDEVDERPAAGCWYRQSSLWMA